MIETGTCHWFVLRTKSRQENIVEKNLKEKHINMLLPRHKKASRGMDKKKVLNLPLFPGYIFVQLYPQDFEPLRFIPGSCGLVSVGNEPAKMPESDLNNIKIMMKSGAKCCVNTHFIPGKKVEVLSGPLKGVQGELVRIKNEQRLIINVELVGKTIDVEIDTDVINVL